MAEIEKKTLLLSEYELKCKITEMCVMFAAENHCSINISVNIDSETTLHNGEPATTVRHVYSNSSVSKTFF